MRHIKNLILAAIMGLVFVGIISGFPVSSKLPPCDLVSKGIGISTYGCRNDTSPSSPCMKEVANSKSMVDCIEKNYYLVKTFPFGFKQYFGPNHNLAHPNAAKPLNENRIASFIFGFGVTIVLLYTFQTVKKKPARRSE